MPKAAWLCADSVYQKIRNATDNQGCPLLDFQDEKEKLMGKPIYISPSLASSTLNSLGFSPLIFGDLDHFHIRVSRPTIQRTIQQGISDITRGEALYVGRIRMDSNLFDPSSGSAPPIAWSAVTT